MNDSDEKKDASPLKDALSLFSASAVILLPIVVFHEAGYFLVIDIRLMRFLDIGDYLTNALSWLPITFSIVLVALLISATNKPAVVSPNSDAGDTSPEATLGNAFMVAKMLAITAALAIPIIWLWKPQHEAIPIVVLLAGMILYTSYWLLNPSSLTRTIDSLGPLLGTLLIFLLPFILIIGGKGAASAYADLATKHSDYQIKSFTNQQIVLLRVVKTGIIVRRIEKNMISVITTKGEKIIEMKSPKISTEIGLCNHLDIWCSKIPVPKTIPKLPKAKITPKTVP